MTPVKVTMLAHVDATDGGVGAAQRRGRGVPKRAPETLKPVATFPALSHEAQVWEWAQRPSGRADREFKHYESSVPPSIANVDLHLDRDTLVALNDAIAAVTDLERDPNVHYAGIAGALLRSESVASSKIERLDVDARSLGMAAIDELRPKSDAAQVWANVTAMTVAINAATTDGIAPETFNMIHLALMRDDPFEGQWAGRLRDMPSWIGGSDACPRDAVHIPPTAHRLPALMADLSTWCERADITPLTRAAIAHAQFETIHPYTDGNGRTGRAIIHTILRRGGTATFSIVPTSSALLADVDGYFNSLESYRQGDVDTFLRHFASATTRASREAQLLGAELREISLEMGASGAFRPGSIAATIVSGLVQQPVISATRNAATTAGRAEPSTIYRAIESLESAGILTEITDGKRNRVWIALSVTAALDEFGRRLGRRQPGW